MMRLRVANFAGLSSADIPIQDIVLVAGRNGAGKTSLLQAIATAATGTLPTERGDLSKKDSARLLHAGTEEGAVSLDWGSGSQALVLPGAKLESRGAPMALPSPLAMGAHRLMGLSHKERARELTARLQTEPTVDDLAQYLAQIEGGDAADAAKLWERISISGWDSVLKSGQEGATKLKGRWEQITGTGFGVAKAPGWRPAVLMPGENPTTESVEEDLAAAQAAMEKVIAAGAVDDAELARLNALAGTIPDLQQREAALGKKVRELTGAVTKLAEELNAVAQVPQPEGGAFCPHCNGPVKVTRGANSNLVLSIREPQSKEEWVAANQARYAARCALQDGQKLLDAAQAELSEAMIASRAARAAAKDAEKMEQARAAGMAEGTITDAKLLVATLQAKLDGVKAMRAARAIYLDWKRVQPMLQALAPDGLRAAKLTERLEAFNQKLNEVGGYCGYPPLAITAELDATLAGRAYAMLSESEQWRVDSAITLALAKAEGAPFVVLDRMDILVRDARPMVFRGLQAIGIPAVIACTAPDNKPGSLPALDKAGLGSVWWIEDGRAHRHITTT